jgi:ABC-2 type transport system ATP-binding protein
MENILSVKGLSKSFGHIKAVDSLSFDVNKGDIYGFLGPNGSGKSTSIRMMLGLIFPNQGNVNAFGLDFSSNRFSILKRIGALVERPDFYENFSAYKNLQILNEYASYNLSKKQIHAVLDLVGLLGRADSKVDTYSQGMRQRLGIAQALMHDPEFIILDEPANGLDPQGIKDIRDLILHLNKDRHKTIFISSHILKEIELISNRMLVINKGKKIVEGDVQELISQQSNRLYVEIENPENAVQELVESQFKSEFIEVNEDNLLVFDITKNRVPALNTFLIEKGYKVYSVEYIKSLEDYFLNIM